MKVLLVNPNREMVPWPAIPIGLCAVASATERAGHQVEMLDLTFTKDPYRATLEGVRAIAPDAVGVTVRNLDNCNFEAPVFFLEELRDCVVRAIREAAPDAPLVIGGSAVNVAPYGSLDYLGADYAMVGEGEESFPALLDALERSESSGERVPEASVKGILSPRTRSEGLLPILDTGRQVANEPRGGRAIVADIESARSEAWRWVALRKYAEHGTPYPIQTKRGCALKCVYCVYNSIEGHRYRLRDPQRVADEIEEAVSYGVDSCDFVDSTFNLPLRHARALCEELGSRDLSVGLSTMGINPAGVSDELIVSMKRAGFQSVMCTPESASEVTLASLQKGFGVDAVERAARALREHDVSTYWFFMLGAPGETLDSARETLEFCERHIPRHHMVLLSVGIRVYPGTPLEVICKDSGWFERDESLFMPSWYFSPDVDLAELYRMLSRASERHPNWMINAEALIDAHRWVTMRKALRLMGQRGPFWQVLPKLFRVRGWLGQRRRQFREVSERVREIHPWAMANGPDQGPAGMKRREGR